MSKSTKKSSKSTRAARRGANARIFGSERLELRSLMAGNIGANPWHNDAFPADVDGDQVFGPRDALVIINGLNSVGARELFNPVAVVTPSVGTGQAIAGGGSVTAAGGIAAEAEAPEYQYDVNNDGWLAPIDALRLINLLNGEGEASTMDFRVYTTRIDGSPLPTQAGTNKPILNVGDSVLVQLTVEDMRANPLGVAAAFADLAFGPNLQFQTRETQLVEFSSLPITSGKLITRTSNTAGVIEITKGHGLTIGNKLDLTWTTTVAGTVIVNSRLGMDVVDVASSDATKDRITVSGGTGTVNLPNANTTVSLENLNDTFTLTVNLPGQAAKTTAPISFAATNGAATRSNILDALTATSFGLFQPGEIVIETARPLTGRPPDNANFAVKFGGRFADQNIPEMTANWLASGNTTIAVRQYNSWRAGDPVPPASPILPMSLTFPTFGDVMSVSLGDTPANDPNTITDPNVLNEAGGSVFIGLGGSEFTVFEAQFKVLSPGEFTISTNIGEATQSQPLFFDATTTPQINFGSLDVVAVRAVTAADDTAIVAEDTLASSAANRIDVMANDTLNAGGSKRIVSFANGANGTVTLFTNGTSTNLADDQLIYAPNANFAGTDTFTYVFGDGNGNTATATVTVTVTPVNDAPVNTVPSGSQSTNEDVVKTFSAADGNAFSVSDIDAGSGVIQVTFTSTNATLALANPAGVTATGNGASATPLVVSGTVANINTALGLGLNFTPTANFSGSGTIVMATTDQGNTGSGGARTDTDTITVAISAVNDAPVNTLPATLATDEGVAFTITGLSIADVDAGTAQVRTTLSVTANTGVLQLLTTNGVTVATNGSSSIQITGTLAAINTALNGGVRFTPATGFAGDTQFTMLTTDQGNSGSGGALTDSDTVTLQVRPLVRPRASGDSLTVAEDSSADNLSNQLNVLTNDVANPGATLILKSFTQPMNGSTSTGTVTRDGDTLKFAPAADFAGSTTFTYTINDTAGTGLDSTATVSVTVTAVNDAPTAVADSVTMAEDTVGTFTAATLTGNDLKGGGADEASQTLTITAASVVSGGGSVQVVNGNVVYTPVANYAGPATLTYTIRDNGQTNGVNDFKEAIGTITVTVTEVNDSPTAGNDSGFTVAEDNGPLLISLADLLSNDTKGGGADEAGQTLTVTSVTGVTANAGTVAINGSNVQYSLAADYNGTFVFTYLVTDNGTTNGNPDPKTATGTVTVTVTEVNDAPTATDDTVIGVLAAPSKYNSIQLTANDLRGPTNEIGQSLKVTAVSSTSANGATVSVDANGVVTYTPAAGAITGTSDTFTYTVSDNGTTNGTPDAKTAVGTVTVNIVNFVPMTVSGFVYLDFDNDGAKDAGEVGMGHIDITLTGTDFGGVAITPQTVITNRDGYYEFTNLAPGDYAITQGQASNAVDGKETAGSSRLTSTTNDRFTMNISLNDNVQLQNPVFANNNFAERGLSSNYVSIHLLIVPGVTGDTGSSSLPEGLLFSFNDNNATSLDWYAIEDGWTGVNYSGITLSADRMSANVRVVNAAGQTVQTTATVASGRLRIQQDSAGRAVAYVIGSYGDFNWTAAAQSGGGGEGEGEAAWSAEAAAEAEYAAAIDAAMGEVWG